MADTSGDADQHHGFTNAIVRSFVGSNLSIILILLAAALGITSLLVTPREEDPQIVVPLADVYVDFPGHSAEEVEQLVATPLEKILYEIDGVEYVYSMSRRDQAIITVRYYVGEDREECTGVNIQHGMLRSAYAMLNGPYYGIQNSALARNSTSRPRYGAPTNSRCRLSVRLVALSVKTRPRQRRIR